MARGALSEHLTTTVAPYAHYYVRVTEANERAWERVLADGWVAVVYDHPRTLELTPSRPEADDVATTAGDDQGNDGPWIHPDGLHIFEHGPATWQGRPLPLELPPPPSEAVHQLIRHHDTEEAYGARWGLHDAKWWTHGAWRTLQGAMSRSDEGRVAAPTNPELGSRAPESAPTEERRQPSIDDPTRGRAARDCRGAREFCDACYTRCVRTPGAYEPVTGGVDGSEPPGPDNGGGKRRWRAQEMAVTGPTARNDEQQRLQWQRELATAVVYAAYLQPLTSRAASKHDAAGLNRMALTRFGGLTRVGPPPHRDPELPDGWPADRIDDARSLVGSAAGPEAPRAGLVPLPAAGDDGNGGPGTRRRPTAVAAAQKIQRMQDREERARNRMDYQPELAVRHEPALTRVFELHEDAKRTARRAASNARNARRQAQREAARNAAPLVVSVRVHADDGKVLGYEGVTPRTTPLRKVMQQVVGWARHLSPRAAVTVHTGLRLGDGPGALPPGMELRDVRRSGRVTLLETCALHAGEKRMGTPSPSTTPSRAQNSMPRGGKKRRCATPPKTAVPRTQSPMPRGGKKRKDMSPLERMAARERRFAAPDRKVADGLQYRIDQ